MGITKEIKLDIIKKYRLHEKDTGSPEVQIALLTERIKNLSQHLQRFKKDRNSKRGLFKLVGHRRALLDYLKEKDLERYKSLIKKLKLRK